MADIHPKDLYKWCSIPGSKLAKHRGLKVPFRVIKDSKAMGELMAKDLVDEIVSHNRKGERTRAILPCGPRGWYAPFTKLVNKKKVSLKNLHVFHMDECLDWQGRLLPKNHPFNFKTFMEKNFYGPIHPKLAVPESQKHWLFPWNLKEMVQKIAKAPIDITLGGWGQDGHVAYNQARRNPFSRITMDDVKNSTARIQENNVDTMMANAQRTFGGAWQFVPPMSVTLGVKECLSAKKVRVYSDTGAWKQTALRVALFGPLTPEYPFTLLQKHRDALITATQETARHPISENPDWELF
jgi:glucosamine-6-phosphate deaminase